MQDPQTPNLKTLLRLAQSHLPAALVRQCREAARRRWIAALKNHDTAARQLARQQSPRQLEAWCVSGGSAWAGAKSTRAFAWIEAGRVDATPGNDEFFAEELDRALAARQQD